jgi:hypothetical protein
MTNMIPTANEQIVVKGNFRCQQPHQNALPMLVMMVACSLLSFRKNELTREGPMSKNVPATIPTYISIWRWLIKHEGGAERSA